MTKFPTTLKCVLLLTAFAVACGNTERPDGTNLDDGDLYEQLVGSAVPVDTRIEVDISELPVEDDPDDPREQVGINAPVDALIEFAGVRGSDLSSEALATTYGAIRADGTGFVWTAKVYADGAASLRLRLTDVFLPRNTSLYIYNDDGAVDGPYTGRGPRDNGEIWTHTIDGDLLTLQIHYTGTDATRVLAALRINVFDAGYLDDRWLMARLTPESTLLRSFCTYNEECVENASCVTTIPAQIQSAQSAVGAMLFASGGGYYICTGGLIKDTDDTTDRPLFLTANHCISRGTEAASLEIWYNFTAACGETTCTRPYDDATAVGETVGATILAKGRKADYTLFELWGTPPAGTTALEWSSAEVAYDDAQTLYRFSHPRGAPQAYSVHQVDSSAGTCRSWPRGSRIYSRDTFGATEGGSSGSPVLNSEGKVVGQLSGACGTNVGDTCDAASNATVDGALAYYFADVESILDPAPTICTDADGDGYCAESGDCNDGDPSINPGATDVCDDGIDQDCSGSDCTTGSCDLLPVGASCTDPAQCCGDKCKGKPGDKHCK